MRRYFFGRWQHSFSHPATTTPFTYFAATTLVSVILTGIVGLLLAIGDFLVALVSLAVLTLVAGFRVAAVCTAGVALVDPTLAAGVAGLTEAALTGAATGASVAALAGAAVVVSGATLAGAATGDCANAAPMVKVAAIKVRVSLFMVSPLVE